MSDLCECGHPIDSHGDWNWPVKCLFGPCSCRVSGATLRSRTNATSSLTNENDGVAR